MRPDATGELNVLFAALMLVSIVHIVIGGRVSIRQLRFAAGRELPGNIIDRTAVMVTGIAIADAVLAKAWLWGFDRIFNAAPPFPKFWSLAWTGAFLIVAMVLLIHSVGSLFFLTVRMFIWQHFPPETAVDG